MSTVVVTSCVYIPGAYLSHNWTLVLFHHLPAIPSSNDHNSDIFLYEFGPVPVFKNLDYLGCGFAIELCELIVYFVYYLMIR